MTFINPRFKVFVDFVLLAEVVIGEVGKSLVFKMGDLTIDIFKDDLAFGLVICL